MKKQIITSIACLFVTASLTFGAGEVITFNDNSGAPASGSYNPTDTFSLDVSASWTGYTAIGLSLWLEVPTALASSISITSESVFTWTDPTSNGAAVTNFVGTNPTNGADVGFQNENRDLGSTSQQDPNNSNFTEVVAGTGAPIKVSTLNFSLSGAPAGTYTLKTVALNPRVSEITEGTATAQTGTHNLISQGTYVITIVPEPATWSLMGLGGIGALGLTWLRARRRS